MLHKNIAFVKKRKIFLASKFGLLFLSFPVYCLDREVIEGLFGILVWAFYLAPYYRKSNSWPLNPLFLSQFPPYMPFSCSGSDFAFSPWIWPKLRCSAVMERLSLRFFGKLHGKHFRRHFSCTPPMAYLPYGEKYKQYQAAQKNNF